MVQNGQEETSYVAEDLYLTNEQLMRTENANISIGRMDDLSAAVRSYEDLLGLIYAQDEEDGEDDSFNLL